MSSVNNNEQKLVGYIVYDIWTFLTKSPEDTEWETNVAQPSVHWRKKIYTSLSNAEEAARHIEGKNRLSKAIIIPIYANREDLDNVKKGYEDLKEQVDKLNQNKD